MRSEIYHILRRTLGVVLVAAAAAKGWHLLTEPVASADIWSNRAFLILTVEFEIVLGIWLVSGLFKKAAWLASIAGAQEGKTVASLFND